MIKVPVFKCGQNINGLTVSDALVDSMFDRFFTSKKTIPCFKDNQKIGDVKFLTKEDDIIYFHIDFHTEEDLTGKSIKPALEYAAQCIRVVIE